MTKQIFQSYNSKIKKYVKFKLKKGGLAKIIDVKQKNPTIPFKNIPIKKRK